MYLYRFTKYPRAEILKLGVHRVHRSLGSTDWFQKALNTLKLYAKFANVFMGKRFIVFIRFSKGITYFRVTHFTQLDLKLIPQLHMQMLT